MDGIEPVVKQYHARFVMVAWTVPFVATILGLLLVRNTLATEGRLVGRI